MTEAKTETRFSAPRLGAAAAAALLAALPVRVFGAVWRTEMVNFRAFELVSAPPALYAGAMVLAFLLTLKNPAPGPRLARALIPALPAVALWFAPPSVWTLAGCGFALAWIVCRLALAGAFDGLRERLGKLPLLVFPVLGIAMFAAALAASSTAYDRLYLLMADWGIYLQTAWNTFHGKFLLDCWPHPEGFSCGHFMPAFFALAAPLFGLLPSVWTAFVLNALCLTGSSWLLYRFARERRIPAPEAAALGIVFLLSPSLMNLNLCLFYGFNPVVLFVPLYILTVRNFAMRRYKTAWTLLIFSLLLKETFGVFWCGWGVAAILSGKRKTGAAAIILGAATFLFASRIFFGMAARPYIFDSQFAALGNSLGEIALSPILRPAAFWGQLLREKNALFLILLLLPTFPLSFNRPWLLLAPLPLLVFNCLRGSEQIVNLALQYQTEAVIVLEVLMVQGFSRLTPRNPICRILGLGLGPAESRKRVRFAMTAAAVAAAFTGAYAFGQSWWGANNLDMLDNFGDGAELRREVRAVIPPGADVAADHTSGPQLLFRNRIYGIGYERAPWLFYEIRDPFGFGVNLTDHRKNLADPALELVWFRRPDVRTYFIFRRKGDQPGSPAMPELPVVPDAEWAAWGIPLPVDSPVYSARALPASDGTAEVRFRLERTTDRFGELQIRIFGEGGAAMRFTHLFGMGAALPAALRPGTVFSPGRIPWRAPFHTCEVKVRELPE